MNIHNISEVDDFITTLQEDINKALYRGAFQVRDRAREILLSRVPNANKQNEKFKDTLVDGIYIGKLQDGKIKITSMGVRDSGSGTYRTRFFVGGTKERFDLGGYRRKNGSVQYVPYKKPMSKGSIQAFNVITEALNAEESNIHNNFKNL